MQISNAAALSSDLVLALARTLRAEVIETHISWVLLAEDMAWKIKKPVTLPFVDYGSLASRRRFCEEELRLNRRLAPSLYLGLTRITGSRRAPTLEGPGDALEYAVRMRRFAPGALFSEGLACGTLQPDDVDRLATLVAGFQASAPRATAASGFGRPQRRRRMALAALGGARDLASAEELVALQSWLNREAAGLMPLWAARREAGAVREGHGDLHLDNLVRLPDGIAAFDCIEFDPQLRWIDVLDDFAFALMDFSARGRDDFAFRLLNLWLDLTGEHAALPALRFAVVYRALVRARVAQLRDPQGEGGRCYLDTALAWIQPAPVRLVITHGLPGSGKSYQSQRLLQSEGAIRLRSDVERKRLFGLDMLEDSKARGMDLYGAQATARTYAELLRRARGALQAGYPVILDAAFLRHDERKQALSLASELKLPAAILDCEARPELMRERLLARRGDPSEADADVLARLQSSSEPLTAEELELRLTTPMAD